MALKDFDRDNQIWFFLFESTKSLAYTQGDILFKEVQATGINFEKSLRITGKTDISAEDCAFYMRSESMAAAVLLIDETLFRAIYNHYCTNDVAVTITIRKKTDAPANTTEAGSAEASLAKRQQIARGRIPSFESGTLRRARMIHQFQHIAEAQDAVVMEDLRDLENQEKLTIEWEDEKIATFAWSYVLGK